MLEEGVSFLTYLTGSREVLEEFDMVLGEG